LASPSSWTSALFPLFSIIVTCLQQYEELEQVSYGDYGKAWPLGTLFSNPKGKLFPSFMEFNVTIMSIAEEKDFPNFSKSISRSSEYVWIYK
jgi:hypothetical protein